MLAAADPAFALLDAHERFVDGQRDYNTAVQEFGVDSAQAREAQVDLLRSVGKLNAAQNEFTTKFGPEGEQALRDLGTAAGFYGDDLERLLDFLLRIWTVTRGLPPLPAGSSTLVGATGPFHSGGVVPGPRGSDQLIMAAGGETILPTHKTGGGVGGGGYVTQIFYVDGDLDMQAAADIHRKILLDQLSRYAEVGGF